MATAFQTYNVAPNPNDSPGAAAVPIGSITMWATATAPSQWLLCNGAAVSRNLYAALFSVIGTTYGAGDGSTTFNVPNFAGRVPRGVDGGTYTLAATGGADSVDLKATDLPYHGHNVTEPNGGLGHRHDINDGAGHNAASKNQFNNGTAGFNRLSELNGDIPNTQYAVSGVAVNASLLDEHDQPILPGQRTEVDIRDPYLTINYIIKSA